jgi:hypothetical protein
MLVEPGPEQYAVANATKSNHELFWLKLCRCDRKGFETMRLHQLPSVGMARFVLDIFRPGAKHFAQIFA